MLQLSSQEGGGRGREGWWMSGVRHDGEMCDGQGQNVLRSVRGAQTEVG